MQAQLACSGRRYCDFVVWTQQSIFIERILPDEPFFQNCVNKARKFVIKGILPELLGKWYSRVDINEINTHEE